MYGYGYGFGEAMPVLPPADTLRAMTEGDLYRLMHTLALVENQAKFGTPPQPDVAAQARTARLEVSRIYVAKGQKDLSALDRAILSMDKLVRAMGEAAAEVAAGAGSAAGSAIGQFGWKALPVLPLVAIGAAVYLLTTGKVKLGPRR